jgi:hypothetical protein
MVTDEQFADIMKNYQDDFVRWYKYVIKHVSIDKESFLSEFQYILFKSLKKYNRDKAKSHNGFKRYFFKSLKKMTSSLMRKSCTNKYRKEQRFISFSIKKHDLADKKQRHPLENVIKEDLIAICGKSGTFARLKADGYSNEEIRARTGLGSYQCRQIANELRNNSMLYSELSRN